MSEKSEARSFQEWVLTEAADPDPVFWGVCDHGVSLAPWVDCEKCEVRNDDFDA